MEFNYKSKFEVKKSKQKEFIDVEVHNQCENNLSGDPSLEKCGLNALNLLYESNVKHKLCNNSDNSADNKLRNSVERDKSELLLIGVNSDSVSKSVLRKFFESLLASKVFAFDFIHQRYENYKNQTDFQRDNSKTDYCYALSLSYNKRVDHSRIWDWFVPNMSRKSISSLRSSESHYSAYSTENSASITSNLDGYKSNNSVGSRSVRGSTPFTRSQCIGGAQCVAGCEVHKTRRRAAKSSSGVVIQNSGVGLIPHHESEFSENKDNNVNESRLNRQNGTNNYSYDDESDYEEVTIVRKITNIFRTTVYNTSQMIDSVTPSAVKRVTKSRSFWSLFIPIALLLPIAYYLYANKHTSSLSSHNFDRILMSDTSSSNYALNQIYDELKLIKDDIESLKKVNNDLNSKLNGEMQSNGDKFDKLSQKMNTIEESIINLLRNCCRNDTEIIMTLIDERLATFMALMLNSNEDGVRLTPEEAANKLKQLINAELENNNALKEHIDRKLNSFVETLKLNVSQEKRNISADNLSVDEIKELISNAISIYDADKTGKPDYALEPAGGTVINTRCSETFDPYGVQYRIFGVPVWSSSVSPRAVIQPSISPGECWAFKGSQGYLVVKLSQLITPTAFTYEHIPKQISRDGNINSAPKEFQVLGLTDESDTVGHLLGNYVYEDNGKPMQHFKVQDPNPTPFQFIELVILSNHGHHEYTCLYRFRVHGRRVNY